MKPNISTTVVTTPLYRRWLKLSEPPPRYAYLNASIIEVIGLANIFRAEMIVDKQLEWHTLIAELQKLQGIEDLGT